MGIGAKRVVKMKIRRSGYITPYSARFYPQLLMAQDFGQNAAISNPQVEESKAFSGEA
jgi:hypothetical protein